MIDGKLVIRCVCERYTFSLAGIVLKRCTTCMIYFKKKFILEEIYLINNVYYCTQCPNFSKLLLVKKYLPFCLFTSRGLVIAPISNVSENKASYCMYL